MHVVVDGATWMNERGYGRFTREVLSAAAALPSRHHFTVVVDPSVPDEAVGGLPTARVQIGTPPGKAASAGGRRSVADLWAMSRALARQPGDCVLFPSVYTYVPLAMRRPILVCIHDAIAERFPTFIFPTRRARLYWGLKTRAAISQASRILTVSAHARRAIERQFHLSPDRIRIVPEAAAACFRKDADTVGARETLERIGLAATARFVLYVGGIAPHKNLPALVDAMTHLRGHDQWADLRLLIVGDYQDDVFYSAYGDVRRHIEAAGAGAAVLAGRLADSVVAGLMRLSLALILPSLDEGFGLPAMEAAACGTAVLATRNSAMPDLLGDAAAYFDPAELGSLERELARLLADEPARLALGVRAAAVASRYTWADAGRRLLDVFDELADEHTPT